MTQIHKRTNNQIIYPESDGKPLAENTLQFDYIVTIKEGIEDLFSQDPNVFVAGDLLWYPVEGSVKIRYAPDTMVVFGRPKGFRKSYLQWEEDKIAPQVVFEIWSDSNTKKERGEKRSFYERYGVEEFYAFDPFTGQLDGWQRQNDKLVEIKEMQGWVSPRLKTRFEVDGIELKLYRPDGQPFVSYGVLAARARNAENKVEQERIARERAEQYAIDAAQRIREAEIKAQQEQELLLEQIRAKLRAQGIDPDSVL